MHEYKYKTIDQPLRVKSAVGACRFFASLSPCFSEDEARQFLEKVKEELPGATHHAYAFRIGLGETVICRSDDAGEPSGTAGPPMLGVLEKNELTNVILVGTRYFGGVKLGIGGLVRAYRACAEAGIKEAVICSREIKGQAMLSLPYDYLGAVVQEVEALQGEITSFEYGQVVTLYVLFPVKEKNALVSRVTSASRGKVKVELAGNRC